MKQASQITCPQLLSQNIIYTHPPFHLFCYLSNMFKIPSKSYGYYSFPLVTMIMVIWLISERFIMQRKLYLLSHSVPQALRAFYRPISNYVTNTSRFHELKRNSCLTGAARLEFIASLCATTRVEAILKVADSTRKNLQCCEPLSHW